MYFVCNFQVLFCSFCCERVLCNGLYFSIHLHENITPSFDMAVGQLLCRCCDFYILITDSRLQYMDQCKYLMFYQQLEFFIEVSSCIFIFCPEVLCVHYFLHKGSKLKLALKLHLLLLNTQIEFFQTYLSNNIQSFFIFSFL